MLQKNETFLPRLTPHKKTLAQPMLSYADLLSCFEQHQTARIKAVSMPNSIAPFRIPHSFACLIPELFKIMEFNFNALSDNKPYIGVFGLQPACVKKEAAHFYGSLMYLALSESELNTVLDWTNAKSLIIDFNRGFVLSPQQYLSAILQKSAIHKENVYGQLPEDRLALAWQTHSRHIVWP